MSQKMTYKCMQCKERFWIPEAQTSSVLDTGLIGCPFCGGVLIPLNSKSKLNTKALYKHHWPDYLEEVKQAGEIIVSLPPLTADEQIDFHFKLENYRVGLTL